MSERTTIGGTVYESVGSSSSNLLLKCNGTARIQWGTKLIDLIKNGKIASDNNSTQILVVQDESEIQSDGIYVLTKQDSNQLWIYTNNEKYNLTETDLYISASSKQDITVEQKRQALENIGMYYATLEDLNKAQVQDGLVYVIDNNTLYTVTNGVIREFEAKLKTITVEQESEDGEIINSSFKIVLSVLDKEYLVLENQRITANYSIHVKESAQIGSESADSNRGYRLYLEGNVSYLDVDKINVRHGLDIKDYKEVTFEEFDRLRTFENFTPHQWYLITDFQNHWKLPKHDIQFNRPILLRALTCATLYDEGQLFKDRRVIIHYDPTFQDYIKQEVIDPITSKLQIRAVKARGKITWMRDSNGNEANFDFLDYTDTANEPLTTLHESTEHESLDKSIFPKFSKNNKLTIYDLHGTVLQEISEQVQNENKIEYFTYNIIKDTNNLGEIITTQIDFKYNDTGLTKKEQCINVQDNVIECRGFTLQTNCSEFCGNTLTQVCKLVIGDGYTDNFSFTNNTIDIAYNFTDIYKASIGLSIITEGTISSAVSAALSDLPNEASFASASYSGVSEVNEENNEEVQISSLQKLGIQFDKLTNNSIFAPLVLDKIIKNNYIWDFANSHIQEDLLDNTFIGVYNSFLKGDITGSSFKALTQVILDATIKNSTFQSIELAHIQGKIDTSTFKTLIKVLSGSNWDVKKCSFGDINKAKLISKINNSQFKTITNTNFNNYNSEDIIDSAFGDIISSYIGQNFIAVSSTFMGIESCLIQGKFVKVSFRDLIRCKFDFLHLENLMCYSVIEDFYFTQNTVEGQSIPVQLFNASLTKEVYYNIVDNIKTIQVIVTKEQTFPRGMIVMHSGITPIPEGWAPCDGNSYIYNDIVSVTPNLKGQFIKAWDGNVYKWENDQQVIQCNAYDVGQTDLYHQAYHDQLQQVQPHLNNEFTITPEHLPYHSHDHYHTVPEHYGYAQNTGDLSMDVSINALSSVTPDYAGVTVGDSAYFINNITTDYTYSGSGQGANHGHDVTIYPINTDNTVEQQQDWSNPNSFKIEPGYYTLIFIMKL